MDGKRTLCKRCVQDYRLAGFSAYPDGKRFVKKSCDLCGRPGFDYVILERRRGRQNE